VDRTREGFRCPRDRRPYVAVPRRHRAGRAGMAGEPLRPAPLKVRDGCDRRHKAATRLASMRRAGGKGTSVEFQQRHRRPEKKSSLRGHPCSRQSACAVLIPSAIDPKPSCVLRLYGGADDRRVVRVSLQSCTKDGRSYSPRSGNLEGRSKLAEPGQAVEQDANLRGPRHCGSSPRLRVVDDSGLFSVTSRSAAMVNSQYSVRTLNDRFTRSPDPSKL